MDAKLKIAVEALEHFSSSGSIYARDALAAICPVEPDAGQDERAAFEDWCRSLWHIDKLSNGSYELDETYAAWKAWQARAALMAKPAEEPSQAFAYANRVVQARIESGPLGKAIAREATAAPEPSPAPDSVDTPEFRRLTTIFGLCSLFGEPPKEASVWHDLIAHIDAKLAEARSISPHDVCRAEADQLRQAAKDAIHRAEKAEAGLSNIISDRDEWQTEAEKALADNVEVKNTLQQSLHRIRELEVKLLDADEALASLRTYKPWYDAVTDECSNACIGWNDANPRETVKALIEWNRVMALDPKISDRAAELVAQGKALQAASATQRGTQGTAEAPDLIKEIIDHFEVLRAKESSRINDELKEHLASKLPDFGGLLEHIDAMEARQAQRREHEHKRGAFEDRRKK